MPYCIFHCINRYMFDEPSSYLDVKQRLNAAAAIRSLLRAEKYVIVVEHDLAVLDYLSDFICVLYGVPGAYGVVTMPFSCREGNSKLCYCCASCLRRAMCVASIFWYVLIAIAAPLRIYNVLTAYGGVSGSSATSHSLSPFRHQHLPGWVCADREPEVQRGWARVQSVRLGEWRWDQETSSLQLPEYGEGIGWVSSIHVCLSVCVSSSYFLLCILYCCLNLIHFQCLSISLFPH